ncbi:MAG: hypothetical protein V4488_10395 [Pseudomonadota bacterium]
MKAIFFACASAFSLTVMAAGSPASSSGAQADASVFKTVDKCTAAGCVITCKNNQGAWERIDQAAESITTINYPNGNVRFLLDDGGRGKRTLVYGPNNLACTITGHQ